jgi:hypothetical protein
MNEKRYRHFFAVDTPSKMLYSISVRAWNTLGGADSVAYGEFAPSTNIAVSFLALA